MFPRGNSETINTGCTLQNMWRLFPTQLATLSSTGRSLPTNNITMRHIKKIFKDIGILIKIYTWQ